MLILACVFETIADILFKKGSLWVGLGLYFIGTVFWAFFIKENEFTKAIVVFGMLNLIACAAVGTFYFNEPFGVRHGVGICCAIAAIYLMG